MPALEAEVMGVRLRKRTREEAISRVRAQAQESISVLSGSLACTVSVLAGDELLRASDWQKWVPVSRAELEDQTF